MGKRLLMRLVLTALPICLFAQSHHNETIIAFAHVTIIDVAAGSAHPDMTVVITGNRISKIGPMGKVSLQKGAKSVDATGKFLIPGLWDMHVHALRKERVDVFFPLFVANGVTGIRDMGV